MQNLPSCGSPPLSHFSTGHLVLLPEVGFIIPRTPFCSISLALLRLPRSPRARSCAIRSSLSRSSGSFWRWGAQKLASVQSPTRLQLGSGQRVAVAPPHGPLATLTVSIRFDDGIFV